MPNVIRTTCRSTLAAFLAVVVALTLAHESKSQEPPHTRPETSPVNSNQNDVSRPYVLILPGILGERVWDRRIAKGFEKAGFIGQVEIFDWTRGPLMMVSNIGGDEKKVAALVNRIRQFKTSYPNRPLYLIGHSGGCCMVTQILEELNGDRLIDRAVLLSPGLESNYDLGGALSGTRLGIVSFYSRMDLPISGSLTFVRGLTKLRLEASAAAFGFVAPENLNASDQESYKKLLVQHEYNPNMLKTGNAGGHFGWTVPRFVGHHIVPLLKHHNR